GYIEPTKLQEQTLPKVLNGHDALIKAAPGKDKNISFIIPALSKIDTAAGTEGTTALILTPNADECRQIGDLLTTIGSHNQVDCASIDLDSTEEEQQQSLSNHPQV